MEVKFLSILRRIQVICLFTLCLQSNASTSEFFFLHLNISTISFLLSPRKKVKKNWNSPQQWTVTLKVSENLIDFEKVHSKKYIPAVFHILTNKTFIVSSENSRHRWSRHTIFRISIFFEYQYFSNINIFRISIFFEYQYFSNINRQSQDRFFWFLA